MTGVSEKQGPVALLLCFFLGVLGAHRFYVGKMGSGILMLVTLGGFGIWALVDFVMIVAGKFTDSNGRVIQLGQSSQPSQGPGVSYGPPPSQADPPSEHDHAA
jgi:TM2 domain-containing membrane protein YozV